MDCPNHIRWTKSSIKKRIIVRQSVWSMFGEQTFTQLRTGLRWRTKKIFTRQIYPPSEQCIHNLFSHVILSPGHVHRTRHLFKVLTENITATYLHGTGQANYVIYNYVLTPHGCPLETTPKIHEGLSTWTCLTNASTSNIFKLFFPPLSFSFYIFNVTFFFISKQTFLICFFLFHFKRNILKLFLSFSFKNKHF